MCLKIVRKPRKKSGVGYKIVRKTDHPETFAPMWRFFHVNMEGNSVGSDSSLNRPGATPNKAVYKLGEWYEEKETRPLMASSGYSYEIGIHLYKRPVRAFYPNSEVVIVCEYEDAVASDNSVVVAKRVKPIKVMEDKDDGSKIDS